jgi:hypothetical protein
MLSVLLLVQVGFLIETSGKLSGTLVHIVVQASIERLIQRWWQ